MNNSFIFKDILYKMKNHLYKLKSFLLKLPFRLYQLFISLRLAIFTLASIAFLTAIGTFIESRYHQELANKLIYHSWWMIIILLLLASNLIMVLIDRWPWKKRQVGFILAHIGILTLMLGSLFTRYFGLDGSLRFKEGEKTPIVSVSDMEIKIYSSYDGEKFTLIYEKEVDMFFQKPNQKKPYVISVADEKFVVDKHLLFGMPRQEIKYSHKGGEPAIRFHLEGSRASVVDWMKLDTGQKTMSQVFGLALVSLTKDKKYKATKKRELVLYVEGNKLFYSLNKGRKKLLKKGNAFVTGWMDLKFRLLEFFPKSQKEFIFESRKRPSENTLKAIHVRHQGNLAWIGQNAYVRFFKGDRVYAMAYLNKTYNLGFDLELKDFKISKYQGSEKAKSYESLVRIEDKDILISMNEPLKYGGYTFYQSSFEAPKKEGEAYVSILSVNRDPGRILKYIGAFCIVAGIALLFFRRKMFKKV